MCAAVLAAAVSCNTDEEGVVLDTPVLSIADTTSTSFTVAWEAVENADMYTYEFREEQASTESLSVALRCCLRKQKLQSSTLWLK